MIPNKRKCVIDTAQGWFDEARKAQDAGRMAEALLFMENAFNHTENALAAVLSVARQFPRKTPGPGAASTLHEFQIAASTVWGLDRTLNLIDGRPIPSSPEATSDSLKAQEN